ncbi:MAG: pyruvate ferredoxin oxidoreductase [Halioglobus sp.]|nr:pyruvate ferredoxin oxidoreductase [Halioglobus sp.]
MSRARHEVRIGGFGGQGIVLAGTLLGKAASLYDGREAVFTQSYGPEARGGASRADVIIDDAPVDYPYVTQPDVVAVLFQEAYVKFAGDLRPDGLLVIEADLVKPEPGVHALALPATRIAEQLGRRVVANVVLLGCLVRQAQLVSRDAAEQAIRDTVKPAMVALNLEAFAAGYDHDDGGLGAMAG